MTDTLSKRIDGTHTRLLRTALNVSWGQHLTNSQLYGILPPVSSVIRVSRLQFAEHCYRSRNEVVNSDIVGAKTPKKISGQTSENQHPGG